MIIIYILAVIGGFCLVGIIGIMILIALSKKPEDREDGELEKITCAITNERCIYTERQTCTGCPITEEIGKNQDN